MRVPTASKSVPVPSELELSSLRLGSKVVLAGKERVRVVSVSVGARVTDGKVRGAAVSKMSGSTSAVQPRLVPKRPIQVS